MRFSGLAKHLRACRHGTAASFCSAVRRVASRLFGVVLLALLATHSAHAAIAITNATLTYGTQTNLASVQVPGSATVSVTVTGTVSSGGLTNWRSSTWTIGGTTVCVNHANFNSNGTFSTTFDITAPAATGTYDVVFAPYAGNTCGGAAGTAFTRTGGVVVDNTVPTVVSINRANANPTGAASVSWTVTFSESVTGVDATDFSLVQSGGVSGASITSVTGSGTTWTVTANTGSGGGSLGLNLIDNDTVVDIAGHLLSGAGAGNGNFTGQVYTVDKIAPAVSSIVRVGATPTSAASVQWTVTFSESVTAVDAADFSLAQSGVSGAAITSVTGAGTTWTVTASTGSGDGTLGLNLVDNDTIVDAAANPLGGSGAGNGNFTGEVYTFIRVANFNVVEPAADAVTGTIHTKIAGQDFALDIVALTSSNTVSTGFTGTVAVEVVDNTSGGACAGLPLIATFTNQTFVAADNGRHALTAPNTVTNVYRNAKVRIKYPVAAPTITSCSGYNFAIRPASLALSVTDANRTTAGTTNSLTNVSIPGGAVHNAGRPFQITATARNSASVTTTNYDGSPSAAVLSACAGSACLGSLGTLTTGAWTPDPGPAANGVVKTTSATYDSMGSFVLRLEDRTFANVDAADSTTAQRYVVSANVNVGRFVPDHFNTNVTRACVAGNFTYSGQPFTVQVTAYNAAGAAMTNYDTSFGLSRPVTLSNAGVTNPGTFTNATFTAAGFTGTTGTQSRNDVAYTFAVKETPPLVSGVDELIVRATDDDGVSSSGGTEGTTEIRSGRLLLENASGSELLDLRMPMRVQYYNAANSWVTNTNDSCTTVATLAFSNPQGNLLTSETCVQDNGAAGALSLSGLGCADAGPGPVAQQFREGGVAGFNGDYNLHLRRPGVGNNGSLDVSVELSAAGANNLPWLRYDWDGVDQGGDLELNDDSPQRRATFGIYRGNSRQIYQRERH
jgi:hypothetical protein